MRKIISYRYKIFLDIIANPSCELTPYSKSACIATNLYKSSNTDTLQLAVSHKT